MSGDPFAHICASLDFPMTIVTAFDGREHSGCLVGFHAQCSIAPRRWLVCISKANHTCGIAARTEWLVIHVLRADQHALAQFFGAVSGDSIAPHEKFDYCAWRPGPGGTPILKGCDWLAGRVIERVDAGDHVVHVVEIAETSIEHDTAPQLGSQSVRDITPGHVP